MASGHVFLPGHLYLITESRHRISEHDANYTIEGSRPFRALGAWLAIKEHGFKKYARLIEQNVARARMLADLIGEQPLNRELLYRLHETGIAAPSYSDVNGCFAIRVSITNHRTTNEDLVLFVRETVRIGSELAKEL